MNHLTDDEASQIIYNIIVKTFKPSDKALN